MNIRAAVPFIELGWETWNRKLVPDGAILDIRKFAVWYYKQFTQEVGHPRASFLIFLPLC